MAGPVANHILPDAMLNGVLTNFAPFKTPGDHGSVAKAKAEMAKSKYSTRRAASARASQCKNVLLIADVRAVDKAMLPGHPVERGEDRDHLQGPLGQRRLSRDPDGREQHADLGAPALGQGLRRPVTFFEPLFYGANIIPTGNTNYSLTGLTPAQADGAEGDGLDHQRALDRHGHRPLRGQDRRHARTRATRHSIVSSRPRSCRGSRTSGVTS